MRHIDRLETPEILLRNGAIWAKRFLESERVRPFSSQYAHTEILELLKSMSSHKCFYCERLLKGVPKEVDHYIEVAEHRHLSFLWQNLYLSCDNCNNKLNNRTISAAIVLDPCFHSDEEIEENLIFENELIRPKNNSKIGGLTIQKYKLDSDHLDYLRSRELTKFHDILIDIQKKQIAEGGRQMSSEELEKLQSFANRARPFSLMFKRLLQKHSLF